MIAIDMRKSLYLHNVINFRNIAHWRHNYHGH
nr:MAG TPA: hypothetical protein [Caudoviricetes sp.]DAK93722.1 MAG TPA: hypothetical protein [Caudoviricetes sp.]